MYMTWQLFIFISMIAETAGRLIQRSFLKDEKSDPIAYAALFQLFCGIIVGIVALILGIQIPDLSQIWLNLFLTGVLYGLATICIYKSLKEVEASVFTIIFASRAVFTILGGVVLLHESFLPVQILGAFLILLSVVFVSWTKVSMKFQIGEYFAFAAALLFSIAIINDAFGEDVLPLYSSFRDTAGNLWESDIAYAALLGIVSGDTDASGNPTGYFRPDENIVRAETAKVIYEKIKDEVKTTTL